ncbi:polyamine oxidase [Aspergillus udagawae]|nr:polyamine oxidase [Aspergillus udagawae]
MSGLEILGIAASILQVADLGATVSVKLCTFYRQLKSADQSAQSLSSEVALTCSILRQLGENLKQDEQTRLYSAQAFETAQEVLRECEKVFRRISAAVDESRADATKNAIQRAARRLGFVLMERELDMLKGNLERLKSTMLLLLNVIMYAGQLRSRAESSVLQEQKGLIKVLVEEKKASEARLEELRRFDQLVKDLGSADINHSQGSAGQEALPPYESLAQEDALRELRTYHQLVKRLLQEVDASRSGIERSRYLRFRNGVVKAHAAEVEGFRRAHGEIVTRLFEDPLFSLAPETDVVDTHNQEDDKTEEAERRERKRRRDEELTRHRRLPSESYDRDRLPLQPSGFNPYAGQIERSAPPIKMIYDRIPPFSDYEGTIEGIPRRISPNMASRHAPSEGQPNTRTIGRQVNHLTRQRQAPRRGEATPLAGYEVYLDISVPDTKTELEAKEAADVVDDLLLKWTTIAE